MSFMELLNKRYSLRRYQDKAVERDKIERCLEAARLAPSACNAQPWKFIVVDEPELVKKTASATFGKLISFNHFSLKAPVLVVITVEPPNITSGIGAVVKNIPYYLLDIGIAAEHFSLQAVEEGLGSCMIGWFDEKALREILGIPKNKRVALVLTLGYAEDGQNIPGKLRKERDRMSGWNGY